MKLNGQALFLKTLFDNPLPMTRTQLIEKTGLCGQRIDQLSKRLEDDHCIIKSKKGRMVYMFLEENVYWRIKNE
jgi:hypothetical protein